MLADVFNLRKRGLCHTALIITATYQMAENSQAGSAPPMGSQKLRVLNFGVLARASRTASACHPHRHDRRPRHPLHTHRHIGCRTSGYACREQGVLKKATTVGQDTVLRALGGESGAPLLDHIYQARFVQAGSPDEQNAEWCRDRPGRVIEIEDAFGGENSRAVLVLANSCLGSPSLDHQLTLDRRRASRSTR